MHILHKILTENLNNKLYYSSSPGCIFYSIFFNIMTGTNQNFKSMRKLSDFQVLIKQTYFVIEFFQLNWN